MHAFHFGTDGSLILGKAFKAAEGIAAASAIVSAFSAGIAGRRVVIIDHPPTEGLVPLVEGLIEAGAEVHLRDHHADADRDGTTVARVREILGDRAVYATRAEHPACSTMVQEGEFRGDIVVADADQDGVTAGLKAIGYVWESLDADAAVFDGPASGKTKEALSSFGFLIVRAWGALPLFGVPGRDQVFRDLVDGISWGAMVSSAGLVDAEQYSADAWEQLGGLAEEYERKVGVAKDLAGRSEVLFPGVRMLDVRGAPAFDQPALAGLLDRGVAVTVLIKGDGPIAKATGAQVSLARTKDGETAGINLASLVPSDWARGPEAGVISNTPFLLHLSLERWAEFRLILEGALARE